jgi:hypothetical protein
MKAIYFILIIVILPCLEMVGEERVPLRDMDKLEAVEMLEQAGAKASVDIFLEGIEHPNMDVRFTAMSEMKARPFSREDRAVFWREVLKGEEVWNYPRDDSAGRIAQMRAEWMMQAEFTKLLGFEVRFGGPLTSQDRSRWATRLDKELLAPPGPRTARSFLSDNGRLLCVVVLILACSVFIVLMWRLQRRDGREGGSR